MWKKHKPKYASIHAFKRSINNDFKDELKSGIPKPILNNNLMTDPNWSYHAFEYFVLQIKDKGMPMTTVRFDKYKHKMTKWVTAGIIKSITFHDKLYRHWKVTQWTAKNIIPWNLIWKHTTLYLKKYIKKAKKDIIMINLLNIKVILQKLGIL